MVDYRKHIEAAKQKALAWTPSLEWTFKVPANYALANNWQVAVCAVIDIYDQAIHAAECEGCAVKASAYMEIAPTEGYPHDNLPFHNVFEVDHNPGAQMLRDLQAQLQAQNELLTLLQSQRDAYKTRLDALMTDGLLVDKTKYRLEFADETEDEVRLRLMGL